MRMELNAPGIRAPHLGCPAHDGYIIGCRECLAAWLDRKAPERLVGMRLVPLGSWHSWFDGDAYLGEGSARTGPDVVTADEKARQASKVGPGTTNEAPVTQDGGSPF